MHPHQASDRRALLIVYVVVLTAATFGTLAEVFQRIDSADAEAGQASEAGQELGRKIEDIESELEYVKDQLRRYR